MDRSCAPCLCACNVVICRLPDAEDAVLPTLDIHWCRALEEAEAIARFFVAHAQPAYISHAELQGGRAESPVRWSADLRERIAAEARRAVEQAGIAGPVAGLRCALARDAHLLRGIAFVSFNADAPRPYAVLEDLLVDVEARGQGVGTAFLDWVVTACRAAGARRLFLESGRSNGPAHRFFENHGFMQTSIVMMREI